MSVLPTEEKKDREVLAQELVGLISTSISQNLTKIFWPPGVLTNLPNVLPSPYSRLYYLGGCYMLIWGGHNPARPDFCFKPLVLLCLVELSCIPMLALVGFYWLPPNWRGSPCHSWSWVMDRGRQEKATGSFPGTGLLFLQDATSKKRL